MGKQCRKEYRIYLRQNLRILYCTHSICFLSDAYGEKTMCCKLRLGSHLDFLYGLKGSQIIDKKYFLPYQVLLPLVLPLHYQLSLYKAFKSLRWHSFKVHT